MITTFLEYYRCPDLNGSFKATGPISGQAGHFKWGEDIICYGRSAAGFRADNSEGNLYDISPDVILERDRALLPFDPDEVLQNLQRERYSTHFRKRKSLSQILTREVYYLLRPYLSVPVRKHLQRLKLKDWQRFSFPEWPVDSTVDKIQRRLMALAMKSAGIQSMPFIWFWPDSHRGCAIITHDVEAPKGRDFCANLIDIDESFGFYGSYQVVPEERYEVPQSYLANIVDRGCEVNVHDLNHDGRLFEDRAEFSRRAKKINQYAEEFRAVGFRAGVMYRNAEWYEELAIDYDMSIPNVGHLDPQRGGCCTVMPYFIGNIVELPLTCTQDYTLFHMLSDYTMSVWEQQIGIILANHGLISILVHPDYLMEAREQESYKNLLRYLAELRDTNDLWTPLPRDVAQWWRQRNQMRLVRANDSWQIEGEDSERACVAYARLTGDSVAYSFREADRGYAPASS